MPKQKTELEKSIGKLISAIQKEWLAESGVSCAANLSQDVMDSVHILLQAGSENSINRVLSGLTLQQYLGEVWLRAHPDVMQYVEKVNVLLAKGQ